MMRYLTLSSQRGFSQVELLCVIAIMAILAAILVSSLRSIAEKGASAKCVSNLRQYHTAVDLYANDHQGDLPPDGNGATDPATGRRILTWWQTFKEWDPEVLPVDLLQCPSNPDLETINTTQEEVFQRFTYAYNGHLGAHPIGGAERQSMHRSRVKSLHNFPLFIDASIVPSVGRLRYHWSPGRMAEAGFWHQDQAHVVFLDGHVEAFHNSEEGHQALWDIWDQFWADYAQSQP